MKPAYLLDTNHIGLAVRRGSVVGKRILEARRAGVRIGTCLPVLCEVESGLLQVSNKAKYRQDLDQLLFQLKLWPMDQRTTQIYGDLYTDLRNRGRVLSQVDIMIAALAHQFGLAILTTDADFGAISDLSTEDWSKPI